MDWRLETIQCVRKDAAAYRARVLLARAGKQAMTSVTKKKQWRYTKSKEKQLLYIGRRYIRKESQHITKLYSCEKAASEDGLTRSRQRRPRAKPTKNACWSSHQRSIGYQRVLVHDKAILATWNLPSAYRDNISSARPQSRLEITTALNTGASSLAAGRLVNPQPKRRSPTPSQGR